MRKSCYCGRAGKVEDRGPIYLGNGEHALRDPGCGHLDDLSSLPADVRGRVQVESACRRQEECGLTA